MGKVDGVEQHAVTVELWHLDTDGLFVVALGRSQYRRGGGPASAPLVSHHCRRSRRVGKSHRGRDAGSGKARAGIDMSPHEPVGVRWARAWTCLYTKGLPDEECERRRGEIESDLWEHLHDP